MSERDEVVGHWDDSSITSGVCWAFQSAANRTAADCNPAAGHSPASIGATRHALFVDRLDRVFACGRYDLPDGVSADVGLDLVREELTSHENATMPQIGRGVVRRADLRGSAGWTCGSWRWLLASATADELSVIPWALRSPTKQQVAGQPSPHDEETLFTTSPALHDWLAASPPTIGLDVPTLVVGYSHDVVSDARRVGVGRPRLNLDGGSAWHWWHDLSSEGGGATGTQWAGPDVTGGPDGEPDAPVRLRPSAGRREGAGVTSAQ